MIKSGVFSVSFYGTKQDIDNRMSYKASRFFIHSIDKVTLKILILMLNDIQY